MTWRHEEFGQCNNPEYRAKSQLANGVVYEPEPEQEAPLLVSLQTFMSYLLMIVIGHVRDYFGKWLRVKNFAHLMPSNGYAALNSDFDSFYTRRLKHRLDDCFARPTTGVPGRTIQLLERKSDNYNETYTMTGRRVRALNISSYNYLGFAQGTGGCADAVEAAIQRYGITAGPSRMEGGTLDLHLQAEALVARFVGQESALIYSMGFATNSTTIPALIGKGGLIISDTFAHSSLRNGSRLSGASIRPFKHNDMKDLERVLRESISQGQPRTHRPWKKILVLVEGLYSMEGTMVDLPRLIQLKRKYKFYIFLDEAHSIGALGTHGRGVCDYFGIPPKSIDIHMGTFTKSFGASGGYIAGSQDAIDRLRLRSNSGSYAEAMTPPVLMQIIASTASIMAPQALLPKWLDLPPSLRDGSEGRARLQRLAFNARYLSRGLRKLGFITFGVDDSPVIPLLLFNIGKMAEFSRLMLGRPTPIAVVVVSYPATSLSTARVRFCISAAHTKQDVDDLLRACDEIGDYLGLKYNWSRESWTIDQVTARAVELVNT
ncbi:serine palmitoyltransferase 2 [Auriculariales sp. MPI-PUGE-AT-0066]|nr:serine palmitoyltransferase 2 [Auriculariales sp. MPI-PUGE-AT-0066]